MSGSWVRGLTFFGESISSNSSSTSVRGITGMGTGTGAGAGAGAGVCTAATNCEAVSDGARDIEADP